jgi:hypothetical protein
MVMIRHNMLFYSFCIFSQNRGCFGGINKKTIRSSLLCKFRYYLFPLKEFTIETFEKVFCGHPEIVSGPKNMMILLDAEASYA